MRYWTRRHSATSLIDMGILKPARPPARLRPYAWLRYPGALAIGLGLGGIFAFGNIGMGVAFVIVGALMIKTGE